MKDIRSLLDIDPAQTENMIKEFIKDKTKSFDGLVLGISGGIDSAVCAALAVSALGKGKVFGLILPSNVTPKEDITDAENLADSLGIEHTKVDITEIAGTIRKVSFSKDRVAQGNIMARIRMILLRDFARSKNLLVLGTGNKTELMIGYFTKNGDSGVDILPLGNLYKTQVRILAEHQGIDKNIIKKAPSAGLWSGQTDEDEIGITYDTLDMILKGIELDMEDSQISATSKTGKDTIARVKKLILRSRHKTEPTPVAEVT